MYECTRHWQQTNKNNRHLAYTVNVGCLRHLWWCTHGYNWHLAKMHCMCASGTHNMWIGITGSSNNYTMCGCLRHQQQVDYVFAYNMLWRLNASPVRWKLLITALCIVQSEKGQFVARYCNFPKKDVHTPLHWSQPLFTVTLKDGEGQATCRKKCPSSSVHLQVTCLQYTLSRAISVF